MKKEENYYKRCSSLQVYFNKLTFFFPLTNFPRFNCFRVIGILLRKTTACSEYFDIEKCGSERRQLDIKRKKERKKNICRSWSEASEREKKFFLALETSKMCRLAFSRCSILVSQWSKSREAVLHIMPFAQNKKMRVGKCVE